MGFFSQFYLLTCKNLIVIKRSLIWTAFELVLPLVIGIPLMILITKNSVGPDGEKSTYQNASISTPHQLLGDGWYMSAGYGYPQMVTILYSWDPSIDRKNVDNIMNVLQKRFDRSNQTFDPKPCTVTAVPKVEDLMSMLQSDEDRNFQNPSVYFTKLDLAKRVLNYEIITNDYLSTTNDEWRDNHPFQEPGNYRYWDSNFDPFLDIQFALNSIFTQLTNNESLPSINMTAFIVPAGYQYGITFSLDIFVFLIVSITLIPVVLHTTREIAAEKENGIKDFMSTMGLNAFTFYTSHIFIGWVKSTLVQTIIMIPLWIRLPYTNIFLFIVALYLHTLCASMLAAMLASIFKTTNAAMKVGSNVYSAFIALALIPATIPLRSQVGLSFLSSLNFNAAFNYVIKNVQDYIMRNRDLTFDTFFEDSDLSYSMGCAMCMQIVDIIWMLLVTIAFDLFYSRTDISIDGLFKRVKISPGENGGGVSILEDAEEREQQGMTADIVVENMEKVWGSTGERAVDGLNLKAFRGQVTALLGHNGAGKSTTFSVLAGLTPATSGHVKVDPKKGLCPQANALFDKLNVIEHLWFYNTLKEGTSEWKIEADQLLSSLSMEDKRDTRSMALSGGMKRKLCLMMAVIGQSRVVLLDEPTAGMDTSARNDVKKMLETIKKDRTILLTTHYMDEAEQLGDNISIMVRGKKVASGSAGFLKKRFGTGYILTVLVEDGIEDIHAKGRQVEKIINTIVDGAQLGKCHGRQMEITLPIEKQQTFDYLFEKLEKEGREMQIESFGLSLNTLEQVFLRVGELAEKWDESNLGGDTVPLVDKAYDDKRSGPASFFAQVVSLLRKKYLYYIRNWFQLLFQIVLPLAFIFGVAVAVTSSTSNQINGDANGNNMGTLYQLSMGQMGHIRAIFREYTSTAAVANVIDRAMDISKKFNNVKRESLLITETVDNFVLSLPRRLPPPTLGIEVVGGTVVALMNTNSYHSMPVAASLAANSYLTRDGKPGEISTNHRTYSYKRSSSYQQSVDTFSASINDYVISVFAMVCCSLLTSAFVLFLIFERTCKFAHQQTLTSVSPLTFWFAHILYDLIIYLLMAGLFTVAFVVYKWLETEYLKLIIIWLLYIYATLPIVYNISFVFDAPSKANTVILLWQTVGSYVGLLVVLLLSTVAHINYDVLKPIMIVIFPSYGLTSGIMAVRSLDRGDPKTHDAEMKGFVTSVICLTVTGTISTILFIVLRIRQVRQAIAGCRSRGSDVPLPVEDPDVQKEREYVDQHPGGFTLEVSNLTKNYGKFTAVNKLTFGVKSHECFGLLGVNGAGKTTTFAMLTGEQFPTHGYSRVRGGSAAENGPIGYCPQFDAMLVDLTGRETLEILCSLHGYSDPSGKAESILRAVHMLPHADKMVKHYSGGQKRKISVGISLLAHSNVIILDEPTAGIDPKARRDIWTLLCSVRDSASLLLTSHSMDECEALCTKIAILGKGMMIAVGSTQHLKSRFGNSYIFTMIFGGEVDEKSVTMQVQLAFPGSLLESHQTLTNTMKFRLLRHPTDRWSHIWNRARSVLHECGGIDFFLTQSTLEETFLRLSKEEVISGV